MRRCLAGLLVLTSCGGLTATSADAGPTSDATTGNGSSSSSSGGVAGNGASSSGSFGTGTDAGSAGPVDSGVEEAGGPTDANTLPDVTTTSPADSGAPPAVGTPECQDVPCVLCADGYYHCHSQVYPPCPPGLSTGSSCIGYQIPSYGCFYCPSDGKGWLWQCVDAGWNLSIYDCTP